MTPKKEDVQSKAARALKHAVKDLIKERRKEKDKIVIWKNGKVVRIPA